MNPFALFGVQYFKTVSNFVFKEYGNKLMEKIKNFYKALLTYFFSHANKWQSD